MKESMKIKTKNKIRNEKKDDPTIARPEKLSLYSLNNASNLSVM
jgi:hypothetical protein